MGNKFRGMEDPDGNLYEVETDDTLTKEEIPADAKAVGDRFAELKETLLNKLTLGYGTDGKIYTYFDRKPIGTGIGVVSDETVSGTINEDNNLIFNDNIPDGEYSLYFLSENNVYSDAMDMVVSEIAVEEESEITNLISAALDPNVTDIYNGVGWKANVRWSTSGASEVTLDDCVFTGLIPIGASGDVFRANLSVEYSAENKGQILFYALDGTLITSSFKVVSQYATCNSTYTQWVFGGGSESVPDDAYYFRVVLSPYSDNPIITRNQEIEESTEEDYLGVNLLTMENLEIKLNQRYSGSSFAYVNCAGMIAFMIPMTQVLNRKIRFTGFEYGAAVASQPLWFTLDSLNNSLGYLTGTSSSTGIWGSAYLTQEDDGSCTLPINSDTIPTDGAVTLVINMVVDPDASTITEIPDTMSIVIEEDE